MHRELFWGHYVIQHRTQLQASMILRSTATALVRHALALAVLLDLINRVQVTPSYRFTAAPETAVFPRLKSVLVRKPRMLLLQSLFRDNGVCLVSLLLDVTDACKGRFTHSMPCPCRSPAMPCR